MMSCTAPRLIELSQDFDAVWLDPDLLMSLTQGRLSPGLLRVESATRERRLTRVLGEPGRPTGEHHIDFIVFGPEGQEHGRATEVCGDLAGRKSKRLTLLE